MALITQKDFETKAGQEKIVKVIHNLEYKVHEIDQKLHELVHKENMLERDMGGYGSQDE